MNYESYEDLNNAKSTILSLLKTKYGDLTDDYDENVDDEADKKMNDVIKQLNIATSSTFQMIPFIKKEVDKIDRVKIGEQQAISRYGNPKFDKKTKDPVMEDVFGDVITTGNSYYRNVNSLLSFNQHTLTLSTAVTNANRIFQTLIQNIGYVEPQTIDIYNQTFTKFEKVFDELFQISVVQGNLTVIMKDGNQNEFDKQNLKNEFNNAINQKIKLEEYDDLVRHNYNYKSSTVASKKKKYNNDDEEDDEDDDDDDRYLEDDD